MMAQKRLPICLFVLCALLASGGVALGRAGGGGGFSGGGGSSSYSGSSYSGSSYSGSSYSGSGYSGGGGGGHKYVRPMDAVVDLLIVAAIFLAGLGVCFLSEKIAGRTGKAKRARKVGRQPEPKRYRSSLKEQRSCEAAIQSRDRQFCATDFLKRFRRAFYRIQKAWSNQDLTSVCHFVSDGIYERFTLQIQEQRDQGYRDHMQKIQIHSARLAEATTSGAFDVLTVEVTASAVDYRVSIKTGSHLSGSRSPEQFTEFWSFVRRRGARSAQGKDGLIEGQCPNCGDSLKINRAEKCTSCGAWLRSGEYDWVLSEITQGCVWRPQHTDDSAIVRRYRELYDPGFNVQHLEDRMSVIFWRMAMAERLNDAKPLLKMATHAFCESYPKKQQTGFQRGERRYFGGCSVGSIDLQGLIVGKDFDHALVEVHWSANIHSVDSSGAVRDLGGWKRYKTLCVLMRKHGVKSNAHRAIDSAHCPKCGAPERDSASHACEFCDSVLNDGRYDWVLSECHDRHSATADSWLSRAAGGIDELGGEEVEEPSYEELLAWATQVFVADHVLDKHERQIISHLAKKQGMSKAMLQDLVKRARDGELETNGPSTRSDSRAWLGMMVDVALLDGNVEPGERRLLLNVGEHVGLKRKEVDLLIDKRRAEQTRESEFFASLREEGIDV